MCSLRKKKKKECCLKNLRGDYMEIGEILLRVASEARTRKKTGERGNDLLDLLEYSNGRTVDGLLWETDSSLSPCFRGFQWQRSNIVERDC